MMLEDQATVKILFFAVAREIMGRKEIEITISPGPYNTQTLLNEIVNNCKDLNPVAQNVFLALNEEYTDKFDNFYLKDGDHIAIIPPLSGG